VIPKSAFCFQTGFHGKKILHFKILVTPQWTQTTPSLLLQADKRLATEGTHWNIIDDVPDTHNMSSEQTQDYYTAKNIQGKLTICILQRLLFLGWFRNNL